MKKFFKSFLAILSSLLCLFTVVGCSQAEVTTLNGCYFLQNSTNISVIGNVDEFNEYKVTFTPSSSAQTNLHLYLNEKEDSNVYTTRLVNTTYNGVECYLLETQLKTSLSYTLHDETYGPYDDYVNSKVYFLSVSDKLKPLYSETASSAHSPVKNADGEYEVTKLVYTYSITYTDDVATVDFSHEEGTFGIEDGKREYKNYDKSTYYFDNVSTLFMPRAINLTDSSSLSFYSIDAISGINRSMKLTADSSTPSATLKFSDVNESSDVISGVYWIDNTKYFKDENNNQVIPCQVVNFSVAGTFSGSSVKCWYASTTLSGARARLIKMQTEASYSLGTFTYIISETKLS